MRMESIQYLPSDRDLGGSAASTAPSACLHALPNTTSRHYFVRKKTYWMTWYVCDVPLLGSSRALSRRQPARVVSEGADTDIEVVPSYIRGFDLHKTRKKL